MRHITQPSTSGRSSTELDARHLRVVESIFGVRRRGWPKYPPARGRLLFLLRAATVTPCLDSGNALHR